MAFDVSGFGFQANIIASSTFPTGFTISAFSDDADAFDVPEIVIGDATMGLNGDLIGWSKAVPIEVTVAVIDGSDDDLNMSILLEANRVGRGKSSAGDIITMSGVYPSGKTINLTGGKIIKGSPASSIATNGRIKTKSFSFKFENRTGSGQ